MTNKYCTFPHCECSMGAAERCKHPKASAATDTGLEIDIEATAENIARSMSNYKNSGRLHGPTYEVAKAAAITALTCAKADTRSQAEELLAAERKEVDLWKGKAEFLAEKVSDLVDKIVAKDARIEELIGANIAVTRRQEELANQLAETKGLLKTADDLAWQRGAAIEVLEAKLAAAEKERDHWKEYSSGQGKLIESGVFVTNDEYVRLTALEAKLATAEADAKGYKSTIEHLTHRAETAEASIDRLIGHLTDVSGKIGAFHDADDDDTEMHILDDIQTIILTAQAVKK